MRAPGRSGSRAGAAPSDLPPEITTVKLRGEAGKLEQRHARLVRALRVRAAELAQRPTAPNGTQGPRVTRTRAPDRGVSPSSSAQTGTITPPRSSPVGRASASAWASAEAPAGHRLALRARAAARTTSVQGQTGRGKRRDVGRVVMIPPGGREEGQACRRQCDTGPLDHNQPGGGHGPLSGILQTTASWEGTRCSRPGGPTSRSRSRGRPTRARTW